jgi:hypothetical protein
LQGVYCKDFLARRSLARRSLARRSLARRSLARRSLARSLLQGVSHKESLAREERRIVIIL